MVNTRRSTMTDQTFDHVVIQLMDIGTQTIGYKILVHNHVSSAYDLAALTDNEIQNMVTNELDSTGAVSNKDVKLPLYIQSSIRHMGNLLRQMQQTNGGTLTGKDILGISKQEWNMFRIRAPIVPTNPPSFMMTNPVTYSSGNNSNDLKDFIKGIKRDKSQYEIMKDEHDIDNWQRSFIAQARAHNIAEVFDPLYTPISQSDYEHFNAKKQFAFTVLDATLKTDMGKTLVHKHQYSGDAQLIWKEMMEYMRTSTHAQIWSSDLLSWITSTKYNETWNGTTHSFILYWLN
jgi:hypothetical protein